MSMSTENKEIIEAFTLVIKRTYNLLNNSQTVFTSRGQPITAEVCPDILDSLEDSFNYLEELVESARNPEENAGHEHVWELVRKKLLP
jgi:hypothetical protein